jgi:thymidylate synthase
MENNVDEQYLENLNLILTKGTKKEDRTGISTLSVFDLNMKFDMNKGFPLLTSKKMFTKGIIYELIWLIKGDTNIKYLVDNNINIWTGDAYKNYNKNNSDLSIEEFINKIKSDDMFAKEHGELGPIYGSQWRKFGESKMVIPPSN